MWEALQGAVQAACTGGFTSSQAYVLVPATPADEVTVVLVVGSDGLVRQIVRPLLNERLVDVTDRGWTSILSAVMESIEYPATQIYRFLPLTTQAGLSPKVTRTRGMGEGSAPRKLWKRA